MKSIDFRSWLEANDLWTQGTQQQRMELGKGAEEEIKMHLRVHGIVIEPADTHQDSIQKIDGFWKGEPVQIKIRRSGRGGRNDMAFELLRGHNRTQPIQDQLKNRHSQGRDYKGEVKHYFVQNSAGTQIYYIPAESLKKAVHQAIQELEAEQDGILSQPFEASNGVQLRPTTDRGISHMSRAMRNPNKVMAFIPIALVVTKTYPMKIMRA